MFAAKFPPKTHRVFSLQITGSPAIFHGTSWQVSKKSQAIRCWTILSRDNQGKAAFAAGQLSTESLNWDLFCWWLQHVTCISVVKSRMVTWCRAEIPHFEFHGPNLCRWTIIESSKMKQSKMKSMFQATKAVPYHILSSPQTHDGSEFSWKDAYIIPLYPVYIPWNSTNYI